MQVIEIKNDLVQVRYNTEEQAFTLGDFFVVSDNNSDILAQIIHLETDEQDALCLAKFILNINPDQSTSLYNGYMPSLDSVVSPVSPKEISDFIAPLDEGINAGTLANSGYPVSLSKTVLDFPLYIQADYLPSCEKFLNLIFFENEIQENTIFYDIDGIFENFKIPKVELGKDFKLPLNKTFIDFIYQNDLSELDIAEKSLVQDILLEIKDYITTIDKSFIEFSTLFEVVENQYQEQPTDGLMLFRNKLIEYKQLGIFADNEREASSFNKLSDEKIFVLSVYKLQKNWQKIILKYLSEIIINKTHLVVQTTDKTIDDYIINGLINSKKIVPIFISDYALKCRKLLRSKVPNMIFFQAINEIDDFPLYANFLNILYNDTYIIWGEITNFLSIITSTALSEEKQKNIHPVKNVKLMIKNDENEAVTENDQDTETFEPDDKSEIIGLNDEADENSIDIISEEIPETVADNEEVSEENSDKKDEVIEEVEEVQNEGSIEQDNKNSEQEDEYIPEIIEDNQGTDEQDIQDNDLDLLEEEIIQAKEENPEGEKENIDEIENSFEENVEEELMMLPNEDKRNAEEPPEDDTQHPDFVDAFAQDFENNDYQEEIIEEDLTEEEIANDEKIDDDIEISENEEDLQNWQEPQYETIKEPEFEMPVFNPAEEEPIQDNDSQPAFVEGNIVFHEKYGRGIIEKVIRYGAKTLCSIQFDNIGRRLLDPNLADLKQV